MCGRFKKGHTSWNKGKKLLQFSGKNSPSWKGGLARCIDCNKLLSTYTGKRCSKCLIKFRRGKNHPMFGVHRFGKTSPNWKGGKVKHQRGYVLIHIPEHPYSTKEGYVFEHRLVMENYLGRHLLQSELVHHKNKILNDNRIENLMLFNNQKEHLGYHKQERTVCHL